MLCGSRDAAGDRANYAVVAHIGANAPRRDKVAPVEAGSGVARRPVSRVLSTPRRCHRGARTTIPLGRASLRASRDQPGRQGGNASGRSPLALAPSRRPYSVLLPVGFTLPLPLPVARCALAAPFHPCRQDPQLPVDRSGGLFSVALSLGSPPPAVSRHRIPVEPGLSSMPTLCERGGTAAVQPSGESGVARLSRARQAAANTGAKHGGETRARNTGAKHGRETRGRAGQAHPAIILSSANSAASVPRSARPVTAC